MIEIIPEMAKIRNSSDCSRVIMQWLKAFSSKFSIKETIVLYKPSNDNFFYVFKNASETPILEPLETTWYTRKVYGAVDAKGQWVTDSENSEWFVHGAQNSSGVVGICAYPESEDDLDTDSEELKIALGLVHVLVNIFSSINALDESVTARKDYQLTEYLIRQVASDDISKIVDKLNDLMTKSLFDFHYSIVSLYFEGEQRVNSVGYGVNTAYIPRERDVEENMQETRVPTWYNDIVPDTVLQAERQGRDWMGSYVPDGRHSLLDWAQVVKFGHDNLVRLFAPIWGKERPIGVIEVAYDLRTDSNKRSINNNTQLRMKPILDRFGVALTDARNQRELQEEVDFLAKIFSTQSIRSLSELVKDAMASVDIITDKYFMYVELEEDSFEYFTDDAEQLTAKYKTNILANLKDLRRLILAGTEKDSRKRYIVDSRQKDKIYHNFEPNELPITWLGVPIVLSGRIVGCFGLMDEEHEREEFEDTGSLHPNFGIHNLRYIERIAESISFRLEQLIHG